MVNWLKRFFPILLVTLLSFLPIITPPDSAETLRYAQVFKGILALAGGGAVAVGIVSDYFGGVYRRFNWTRSDVVVLVLAVWTVIILSLRYPIDGVVEKRLALLLVGIVWFFILRTFQNQSETGLESSFMALGIAGVITVMMFLGSLPFLPDGPRDLRIASFGGNPNAMGFFLGSYGVFGLQLLARRSEKLLLLGIPLWSVSLLLTASRNSMLLFGIGATLGLGPRILKALLRRPVFLAGLVSGIILFTLLGGAVSYGLTAKVSDIVSRYTDDRGYLRAVAIRLVEEQPLVGNNWKEAAAMYNSLSDRFLLDAYGEAQQELSFHNLWLTMGVYLGLPGFILGLLLNLLPLTEILARRVEVRGNNSSIHSHALLATGLLIGLLVSLQFEDGYVMGSFALNLAFWSIYAYIVGCIQRLSSYGLPLSSREGG